MHGGDGEVMVEEVVLSSWLMILEGSYYNIQGGGSEQWKITAIRCIFLAS